MSFINPTFEPSAVGDFQVFDGPDAQTTQLSEDTQIARLESDLRLMFTSPLPMSDERLQLRNEKLKTYLQLCENLGVSPKSFEDLSSRQPGSPTISSPSETQDDQEPEVKEPEVKEPEVKEPEVKELEPQTGDRVQDIEKPETPSWSFDLPSFGLGVLTTVAAVALHRFFFH